MNFQLWFRLFLNQLIISLSILVVVFGILFVAVPGMEFSALYQVELWTIPLIIWVLAIVISVSVIYTLYLSFSLNNTYEQIRAKINWLLLGKYHHPIFNQKVKSISWYDNSYILSQDINRIREKMLNLTEDLQEYTAAPVFVGEDTKEEIIEQERARIARELHDSVSQQLFAAMMMLSALTESMEDDRESRLGQQLGKIEKVIGDAQTEMRALLLHLRPIDLQGKSLKEGIENLLRELQTKIPLVLNWELDNPRLETGIEDHLFRIVQEAVSNTMRHAHADKLDVYLRSTVDTITIRIVDDGKGFRVEESQKVGSYGLTNIQERAKSLGGTASILSSPGQGTVIDIKIPYKPIEIKKGKEQ